MRTYDRDTLSYDYDSLVLKAAEVPPTATYFEKADIWVVKLPTGGSFKVLPHQIVGKVDEVAQVEAALPDPEDLAFLRSVIVDHDTEVDYLKALQDEAATADISVDELTDGEYTERNGVVVPTYDEDNFEVTRAAIVRAEDALLAKFL